MPGQQLVLERFDGWKTDTAARSFERSPFRSHRRPQAGWPPSCGMMRISLPDSPKDMNELAGRPGIVIHSTPSTFFQVIAMNTQLPPFNNLKVRQAIAFALPYDQMFKGAMFGRGRQLTGSTEAIVPTEWPQAQPYKQDITRARALLVERTDCPTALRPPSASPRTVL